MDTLEVTAIRTERAAMAVLPMAMEEEGHTEGDSVEAPVAIRCPILVPA